MTRSRSTLDLGASSSCSSNAAGEPIQALGMGIFQLAGLLKSSNAMIQLLLNQIQYEINMAIEEMQAAGAGTDYSSIMNNFKTRVSNLVSYSHMELLNNEEQASINHVLTHLDFFSKRRVNQIVANYLYQHNYFKAGDALIQEAGMPETCTLKSQMNEMHVILGELKKYNINPAINWTNKILRQWGRLESRGQFEIYVLQFEIYRQYYLEILTSGSGPMAGLNFLREYLSPFAAVYQEEFKKLAGCLLWIGHLDESPYADLLSSTTWEKLAEDFTEKFLAVTEQPPDCELPRLIRRSR